LPLTQLIARQLRKPSGFVGKFVFSRLLNRGNAGMNRGALAQLRLAPDDRVIEVGFGGGDLIARMEPKVPQGRIAGVDFSQDMVDVCSRRFADLLRAGRLELRCASVERLPYDAESFTKACTVNTIYFWPEPLAALVELRRVLRPGGRLVVCFNPPETLRKVPYTKHGFSFYEPDRVRSLMEEAGFRSVEMVSGTAVLGEFRCAVGTR
jgi:SAM-dependent methyltransferase